MRPIATLTEQSWWQLGIAALAMFNRGQQYVTASELNRDLAIFAPTEKTTPATTLDTPVDDADRTVENFFFIHAASLNQGTGTGRRTYEFLHATFGEYLIADLTLTLLIRMVAARAAPTVNPFQPAAPLDDALLFALTSHQTFAKRKPILEFATGLFAALDQQTRTGVLGVLDELIRSFHDRAHSDPYPAYYPARATVVSRIAAYSANLVCLRVLLDDDVPTPVKSLFPHEEGELDAWRSTVRLWHSGLDPESWQTVIGTLTLAHDDSWRITRRGQRNSVSDTQEAQLLGDAYLEGVLRTGANFVDDDTTSEPKEQSLLDDLADWILVASGTAGRNRAFPYDVKALNDILGQLEAGTRMNGGARNCMLSALSREAWRLPRATVERGLKHLVPRTPEGFRDANLDPIELISAICSHPDLVGAEVLPSELVPYLFSTYKTPAMCAVVLTWLTATSDDERVDDAFREFATRVGEVARPYLEPVSVAYLPIEVFDYLAHPRTVEPSLSVALLAPLRFVSRMATGAVEPRTFLAVVERFVDSSDESRPDDKSIVEFIGEYLSDRGVDHEGRDLAAVLGRLRRLAGV